MAKLIQKKTPGTATSKSSICLIKVLDLFLLCPILVFVLGILGFVWKCAAPLVRKLGVDKLEVFSFFSPPIFLVIMGHLLQAGALKWSYQVTGL
jgi:hypothetical protein